MSRMIFATLVKHSCLLTVMVLLLNEPGCWGMT